MILEETSFLALSPSLFPPTRKSLLADFGELRTCTYVQYFAGNFYDILDDNVSTYKRISLQIMLIRRIRLETVISHLELRIKKALTILCYVTGRAACKPRFKTVMKGNQVQNCLLDIFLLHRKPPKTPS